MKASIDWNVGLIRAGKDHHKYGDPFEFIVSIMRQDKKAFLMGASGTFNKETYQAVHEVLKTLDLEIVEWERKNIKPKRVRRDPNEKTN